MIQMPRAQSLTSLSLNFISHETLAGSNRGESTRAICVLASPGVSRVMDPLERGKGRPLARTALLWVKLSLHGGMAALKPDRVEGLHGRTDQRVLAPLLLRQTPTQVLPWSTGASEHRCPAQADAGSLAASWVHPPTTYLQLQVFLISLSVERKARGDVLHWAAWLRREAGRALSAGSTRTGRGDEAALKPCDTHLLCFFPPQWNRWPGGKRSN